MRIKFKKTKQKEFINEVLNNSHCPSLRSLLERGLDIPYPTLKSYYNENRTLPKNIFEELIILGKLEKENYFFEELDENWGQIIGGKS